MITRILNRHLIDQKPYEVWNAFVDLLANENHADLDEVQRVAQLCFWYNSEVQNGGHLQFFENRGTVALKETLIALKLLGAPQQNQILGGAGAAFLNSPRDRLETVEDYVTAARDSEFSTFDSAYHNCEPSIQKLLEDFLEANKDHFIEILDGK